MLIFTPQFHLLYYIFSNNSLIVTYSFQKQLPISYYIGINYLARIHRYHNLCIRAKISSQE